VVSNDAVRTLAQADEFELVKQIHEYYGDFYALMPTAFSLSLPANTPMTTPVADRTRDGLFALLLALKKKPAIRYQVSSHDAGHIAALRMSLPWSLLGVLSSMLSIGAHAPGSPEPRCCSIWLH
jgi:hypothetical protein